MNVVDSSAWLEYFANGPNAGFFAPAVEKTSELLVREEIKSGELVRVLPEYEIASNSAIWAVYPSSKHVLPKLRVLLDFLAVWFRAACGEGGADQLKLVAPSPLNGAGSSSHMLPGAATA